MSSLYLDSGYVNARLWFDDPAPFIVALGGRGIGKTFGALSVFAEGAADAGKLVYMRRTQAQIDACKLPELNPFKSVNYVCGTNILLTAMGKYTAGIYNGKEVDGVLRPDGEPRGIGIALSVFSNIRGVDGLGYETVIYDEFIKESHERPIKNEGDAFLNCYETLNRNREIQGRKPLKMILLSNTNDLASPVLASMGLIEVIERMQRRGKERSTAAGGAVSIYLYQDSPISAAKKSTALYKLTNAGGDFAAMALDNAFSAANYEFVEQRPIAEYTPLVSVGNVTVYRHKTQRAFYVVRGVKAEQHYSTLPLNLKAFRHDHWYLYEALLNRELRYSSAAVKIEFESVWR